MAVGAARRAPAPRRVPAPRMADIDPTLIAQMGAVGGLVGGGFALDAFLDVEEPEEPGAEEGAEVHLWMQAEQIKRTSVTKLN